MGEPTSAGDAEAKDPHSVSFQLTLKEILQAAGIPADDVLVIRHTHTTGGLQPDELTPEKVLSYTREQLLVGSKVPPNPPRWWVILMADGGLRSRLLVVYENLGEMGRDPSGNRRYFNLRESSMLSSLRNRLVIRWSTDAVNWAKTGATAATFPVVEISDPHVEEFPGYDSLVLGFAQLQDVVAGSRYARWRTALQAVQGIYVIADASSGKLYVGKADGSERILGRWKTYAETGHGHNIRLMHLLAGNPEHARHFRFSLLRVFGPSVPQAEVDRAEAHYKKALLTIPFGLNGS